MNTGKCVFMVPMKIVRHSLRSVTLVLALIFVSLFTAAAPKTAGKYLVYVGTYTEEGSKSKGIYAYRYDAGSGEITALGLAAETTNPSFVAPHPNGKFLYAVNEVGNYKGPNSGGVSAFAIDHATGKLTFLNEVASRGADPCYITVDETGKYVLVANYTGGSVAVFPVLADGKLGEASSFVQHTGKGPDPKRQEGPHAHSIDLSPDNRFAMVDDLGLDELLVYKFDSAKGSLTPNDPPYRQGRSRLRSAALCASPRRQVRVRGLRDGAHRDCLFQRRGSRQAAANSDDHHSAPRFHRPQ